MGKVLGARIVKREIASSLKLCDLRHDGEVKSIY